MGKAAFYRYSTCLLDYYSEGVGTMYRIIPEPSGSGKSVEGENALWRGKKK